MREKRDTRTHLREAPARTNNAPLPALILKHSTCGSLSYLVIWSSLRPWVRHDRCGGLLRPLKRALRELFDDKAERTAVVCAFICSEGLKTRKATKKIAIFFYGKWLLPAEPVANATFDSHSPSFGGRASDLWAFFASPLQMDLKRLLVAVACSAIVRSSRAWRG